MKKMSVNKPPFLSAFAVIACFCASADQDPTKWDAAFNVDLSTYAAEIWNAASGSVMSASGKWEVSGGGEVDVSPSQINLCLHQDGELSFTPIGSSSRVTTSVTFSAYEPGDLPAFTPSSAIRGCFVLVDENGQFSFRAYSATGWTTLSAEGIVPADEYSGTLTVESTVFNNNSAVRYILDGKVMRDASGNDWLLSPNSHTSPKITEVAYRGSGSVTALYGESVNDNHCIAVVVNDGSFYNYYAGRTEAEEAVRDMRKNGQDDAHVVYLDNAFRVTPYIQHVTTNAVTIMFFTETNGAALVTWDGNNKAFTHPELAEELFYSDVDQTEARKRINQTDCGPIQPLPWCHRLRIEGLEPGRSYSYQVSLEGGHEYYTGDAFRTAPANRDTPIRFLCYSDCETEAESTGAKVDGYKIDQTSGYASNIVSMVRRQPDFIAIAGDLVQYGNEQRDWDEFWRHNAGSRNRIAGSVPILAAPGNHDYLAKSINNDNRAPYDGGEAAIKRYLRYFEFEPNGVDFNDGGKDRSELFHRFDYGRATVIFMDANNGDDSDPERDTCTVLYRNASDVPNEYAPTTNQGPCRAPDFNIGSPQFIWLTNQLADAQAKGQFTFIVNHHCPYSVGYHNRPNKWRANSYSSGDYEPYSARAVRVLTPYFIKYGVTAWIAGHDEIMEHSRVRGFEELPDGRTRLRTLEIYDVGNSGDGLRGGGDKNGPYYAGEKNKYEVYRAYVDSPDGVHYGHLEVNINTNAQGIWQCTISPRYVYVNSATDGPFDYRTFPDEITRRDPLYRPRVNAVYLR